MITSEKILTEGSNYLKIDTCDEINKYAFEDTLHHILIPVVKNEIAAVPCWYLDTRIELVLTNKYVTLEKNGISYLATTFDRSSYMDESVPNVLLTPDDNYGSCLIGHRQSVCIYKFHEHKISGMTLLEINQFLRNCFVLDGYNSLKVQGGISL